ncbi:MAG TPA: hypothetical protein ENN30_02265 [Candidatus Woesearchaeota archaeon]|nr:hypothetical protein [Candidatus Woesearchaeota archaeon]
MKKTQGLPMQTIAIIIIVVLVLVAVLLFFFGAFGKSGGAADEQAIAAECQSRCVKLNLRYTGSTYDNSEFCSSIQGTTKKCDAFIVCEHSGSNSVVECSAEENT